MKNNKFLKYILIAYLIMFGLNKVVYAAQISCDSFGDFKTDLQNVFNLIKIIVPLLVIGLSIYDFIKAVTAKDDKDLKQAFQKMIKRFIYAVILFFLPVLLNLILDLVGTNSNVCIE